MNFKIYFLIILDEVLCQVSAEDIPEHLKVRFESEKKRELEKRQEREEANNYCEIAVKIFLIKNII